MSEPASTGRHPAAEEIAAFLDGRLDRAAADHLVAHLAACAECDELFAETARFLRDEERGTEPAVTRTAPTAGTDGEPRVLRPAAGRWRRHSAAVAVVAVAAALAAVAVWNPLLDRFGGAGRSPTLADLTATLPPAEILSPALEATWEHHGWPTIRGGGPATVAEREAAFRIGVRVVELDLALAAGDARLAGRLTHQIEQLLAPLPGADPLRLLYAGDSGVRGRLAAGEPPATLLSLNRQGDELLPPDEDSDFSGFVDGFWYGLGKWTGAAQLAAASGDAGFFTARANRRFLSRIDLAELPAEVAGPVLRLRELTAGDPAPRLAEIAEQLRLLVAVGGGGEATIPR